MPPPSLREEYAILVPSGEKLGAESPLSPVVTSIASPPAVCRTPDMRDVSARRRAIGQQLAVAREFRKHRRSVASHACGSKLDGSPGFPQ
jgi:hypothetical protein